MTLTIRRAVDTDLEGFRDLRLQALRDHPEAYSADYEAYLEWPTAQWQERLGANPIYFAVDETAEKTATDVKDALVGMAGIFPGNTSKIKHCATIWGVYVRPTHRGQGLAGRLVLACVDWARQQSLRLVTLSAVTSNTAAVNCYKRCGFTICGVEPDGIYSNGIYHDEFTMIKWL
jgi:ribosomal protein S18 acetylase RimI-like enzyme